jgi:CRISPR-associated protein Cas2
MFVSIALDPGSEARAKELADLLAQYGFEKVQRGLWESAFVDANTLSRLKRDLDQATDAFDRLRFFQFPVDGTLVLTSLQEKKWRRMVAKGADTQPSPPKKPEAQNSVTISSAARDDIYRLTRMGWTVSQISSGLKISPQVVRAIQKGRD